MFDTPKADVGAGGLRRRLPLLAVLLALGIASAWVLLVPQPERALRLGVTLLAVSSGRVAVGNADGRVAVLSLKTFHSVEVLASGKPLNDLRFSPDGRNLAIASSDVYLWGEGGLKRLSKDGRNYGCVRFDPTGRVLYWSTGRGEIEAFDLAAGRVSWRNCCSTVYGDWDVSFDGKTLASAGHEPRLWRAADGELVRSLLPYDADNTFRPVLFSQAAPRIFLGGQDGRVRDLPWDLTSGEARVSPAAGHYIDAIVELGGEWIAYASSGFTVHLWQPMTGRHFMLEGAIPSSNLGRSAEGDLVIGTDLGQIEVWDIRMRRLKIEKPAWPVAR